MQVNSILVHSEFSFESQELKKIPTLKIICCKFCHNKSVKKPLGVKNEKKHLESLIPSL